MILTGGMNKTGNFDLINEDAKMSVYNEKKRMINAEEEN